MVARRTWYTLVSIVAGIEMLFLIAQYFLGLWTNVYAPAAFTSNTSFPALDWHYNIGFTLFVVGIVVVILAGLARDWRATVGALVVVAAVYVAGNMGAAYVGSSPNDPIDSFGMGVMFLVALFATSAVLMAAARGRKAAAPSTPPAPAQPTPA